MKKTINYKTILVFVFVFQLFSFNSKLIAQTIMADSSKQASVVSVKSIPKRSANVAVLGDYIQVKVENLDLLLGKADSCCNVNCVNDTSILLCFNGMPRKDLYCCDINRVTGTLLFKLDRDSSESVKKLSTLLLRPWQTIILYNLSVCVNGGKILPTKVSKFTLQMMPHRTMLTVSLFLLGLLISFYFLVEKTSLIRSGDCKSQFSLAQTQLGFWTIIIAMSAIYIWTITGCLPQLTNETLVLMGISVATIAGGKMVTYSQRLNIQTAGPSKGFIIDILSDNENTNIHRFQMVLWTFILGVYFLIKVVSELKFPMIDTNYLLLTGISSGTYLLLKTSENSTKTTTTSPPTTSSDPVSAPATSPDQTT